MSLAHWLLVLNNSPSPPMKKVIIGFIIGVCAPFLAGYLFVISGGMPVATKGKPLPLEKFLARKAQHAAYDSEASKPSPFPADEPNFIAGARIYQTQCAVCHGTLDHPASAIAKGLFPMPPQLLPPKKGVTDDEVGETYWKVKNGLRLTGMPGYTDSLSDAELWQVSLLLRHADKLPPSVLQVLRGSTSAMQ
jgi:thiosulfate dehydrogenase